RARSKPTCVGKHLKAQRLDEHGAHLVTRQREAATGTMMPPLGQVFRDRLTTDAGLAGVAWIHGYAQPAGSLRLADENSDELAPRGVTNAPGQGVVAHHVLDCQVFVADDVERVHQLVRGLMLEVPPHVGDLLVQAGHTPPLLGPSVAPALLARQTALGTTQARLSRAQGLRMLHRLAC